MGSRHLGGRADRPVRRHPLAGGVKKGGRQFDQTGFAIDSRSLDRRYLVLAQAFANDVQTCGEGGIAKGQLAPPREGVLDGGSQRLFRVDDLGLRLGQGAAILLMVGLACCISAST